MNQVSPMIRRLRRWRELASVETEERTLSGTLSGVLYLTGTITLAAMLVLPGVTSAHWQVVVAICGAAGVWGTISARVVNWQKAPPWLIHVSAICGFGIVAAAIASTGGAASPAWVYLFFIVVFAAYFFPAPVAMAYIAGSGLIQLLPLLYDGRAQSDGFAGLCAIAVPAFFALGGAIVAGKRLLVELRGKAEKLAGEQSALRRVATAAASGNAPEETYVLVAEELGRLLHADGAGILRFESDRLARVTGSWSNDPDRTYPPGTTVPVEPGSNIERALRTDVPVRVDRHEPGTPAQKLGYACSVVAPVHVDGRVWGILVVADTRPASLPSDAEQRLAAFGDILASAISNIEDRAKLAARASTDPLTGLANHRAFHERLQAEVSRAVRHGRPLSVALVDVDNFKPVNDVGGHELGDQLLAQIAARLRKLSRVEDTLARIGGDEFAWILPEADSAQALIALDRARCAIAEMPLQPTPITVSAGICDTTVTEDPHSLLKLADGALYWSKAHGRNLCTIYREEVVQELSAEERAEHLERSHALLGLRALARAIDAKDPTTQRHSERVSELAGRLATIAGWHSERVRLLSEAGLVHDVGKIGVPDAVLLKNGPLTPGEFELVKPHAELGARIVEDVLTPEQVSWIRWHHERPDGRGYPDGRTEPDLPEGACLLAIADAWDTMTSSRVYSEPKSVDEALAECRSLVGQQFTRGAVEALVALLGAEDLTGAPASVA